MDQQKLITVIVWATIAVIAYELYKSVAGGTLAAPIPVSNPQQTALNVGNLLPDAAVQNSTTDTLLENDYQPSPAYFASGGEMGVLGEFGY